MLTAFNRSLVRYKTLIDPPSLVKPQGKDIHGCSKTLSNNIHENDAMFFKFPPFPTESDLMQKMLQRPTPSFTSSSSSSSHSSHSMSMSSNSPSHSPTLLPYQLFTCRICEKNFTEGEFEEHTKGCLLKTKWMVYSSKWNNGVAEGRKLLRELEKRRFVFLIYFEKERIQILDHLLCSAIYFLCISPFAPALITILVRDMTSHSQEKFSQSSLRFHPLPPFLPFSPHLLPHSSISPLKALKNFVDQLRNILLRSLTLNPSIPPSLFF